LESGRRKGVGLKIHKKTAQVYASIKIIKQGFFNDSQSKEGMPSARKGKCTEEDL